MTPRVRNESTMSQESHDLSGFDENIILTNDSNTGLSDKVADMDINTEADDAISVRSARSARSVRSTKSDKSARSARSARSTRSVRSARSDSSSGCVVVVKKEDESTSKTLETNSARSSTRQPRAAAVSANKKLGGKRKLSTSSESSSSSSYNPRGTSGDTKSTPGSATKKKKNDSSVAGASGSPVSQVPVIAHVVQTAKTGRVIIEGLCVTKNTGQVVYPQDSIYMFHDNHVNVGDIKDIIAENKKKWIENGHAAVVFSHTFNGALPTVIGGFSRGFAKSIYK